MAKNTRFNSNERIVSKPGATVEVKIVKVDRRAQEAIERGLSLGQEAVLRDKSK